MNRALFDISQLEILLRPGQEVPPFAPGGDVETRLLGTLRYQLTLLVNRIFQVTNTLPAAGDVLGLEANTLTGWRDALDGDLPNRWLVERRCYLPIDKKLNVALRLRRLTEVGIADEPEGDLLSVEQVLSAIPTSTGKRSLHRWLTSAKRPVRTWQQLARHKDELPSERGFNGRHLPLVEALLTKRGIPFD